MFYVSASPFVPDTPAYIGSRQAMVGRTTFYPMLPGTNRAFPRMGRRMGLAENQNFDHAKK